MDDDDDDDDGHDLDGDGAGEGRQEKSNDLLQRWSVPSVRIGFCWFGFVCVVQCSGVRTTM